MYNGGGGTHEVIILGSLGNDQFIVRENTGYSSTVQYDIETIKPEHLLRIRTADSPNLIVQTYSKSPVVAQN